MDLTKLAGLPAEIAVGDEVLKVGAATPRQIARLQQWLDGRPNPRAINTQATLPADASPEVRAAVAKAMMQDRDWPPEALSPEGQRHFATDPEGQERVLAEALAAHHPDLDAAGALDVIPAHAFDEILLAFFRGRRAWELASRALDRLFRPEEPPAGGPAAPTGGTSANTSSGASGS